MYTSTTPPSRTSDPLDRTRARWHPRGLPCFPDNEGQRQPVLPRTRYAGFGQRVILRAPTRRDYRVQYMHATPPNPMFLFGHPTRKLIYLSRLLGCVVCLINVCHRRPSNQVVRLVLVGGCATGKTCLLRRFLGGYFDEAGQQDYTRHA